MSVEIENGDKDAADEKYALAFEWYLRAADNDDAVGKLYLGYMYEHGLGAKQDFVRAEKYYKDAAKAGNLEAKNLLGCFFINSKPDNTEAIQWFEDAAHNGYAPAQANIGFLEANGFENNKGIPQTPLKESFEKDKKTTVDKEKSKKKVWQLISFLLVVGLLCILFFAPQFNINNVISDVIGYEEKMASQKTEISDLQNEKAKMERILKQAQKVNPEEINRLKQTINDQTNDIKNLKSIIQNLESTIGSQKTEISDLQNEKDELDKILKQDNMEIERLKKAKEVKPNLVNPAQADEIKQLKQTSNKQTNDIQNLKSTIQKLESTIGSQKKEIELLRKQL